MQVPGMAARPRTQTTRVEFASRHHGVQWPASGADASTQPNWREVAPVSGDAFGWRYIPAQGGAGTSEYPPRACVYFSYNVFVIIVG